MTASRTAPLRAVPPSLLVLTGIISVQVGAGLAARLFSQIPPAAVTGLRLWTAAAILALIGPRKLAAALTGLVRRRAWRDLAAVAAFGVTLAAMNFSIYQAFARIPLGIAVTVEFLGPLAVAVAASRRALDLLWVALAGAGVLLLSQTGTVTPASLAGSPGGGGAALTGLVFALVAGAAWAAYIMLSAATGRRFPGSAGLTIAMIVAALAITPAGLAAGGSALLRPGVLATGVAIGLLSSTIPYSLELEALRRIPPRVFGIWMSLEPAAAALIGLVMLSEGLAGREWAAIGCVTVACAGAARGQGAAPADHGATTMGSVPTVPAGRGAAALRACREWRPTAAVLRRIALAGVVANAGIIMTGAAVRLSKSGLGCPDWPQCTARSLVAAHTRGDPMFHTWIEFGNRMLTYVVLAAAAAVLIAAWRFRPGGTGRTGGTGGQRRRDLVWLAAAQPAGVLAQAVLGGIVVLTNLNPAWVSVHFLVSSAVVAAAVVLYARCAEGTAAPAPLVRVDQRLMARGLVAVVAVMLAAGTVVTGTGPLAGAGEVARYHLPLEGVTQVHADIGWTLGMLATVLAVSLQLTGAPQQPRRLAWLMFCLVFAQGAIGYTQYFTGLPAGLVWVHVSDSVLIWIVALRLALAIRDRGPLLAGDQPAGSPGVSLAMASET